MSFQKEAEVEADAMGSSSQNKGYSTSSNDSKHSRGGYYTSDRGKSSTNKSFGKLDSNRAGSSLSHSSENKSNSSSFKDSYSHASSSRTGSNDRGSYRSRSRDRNERNDKKSYRDGERNDSRDRSRDRREREVVKHTSSSSNPKHHSNFTANPYQKTSKGKEAAEKNYHQPATSKEASPSNERSNSGKFSSQSLSLKNKEKVFPVKESTVPHNTKGTNNNTQSQEQGQKTKETSLSKVLFKESRAQKSKGLNETALNSNKQKETNLTTNYVSSKEKNSVNIGNTSDKSNKEETRKTTGRSTSPH